MMNEFVTYEIALKMKVIGYDEPCMGCYFGNGEKEFFPGSVASANELTKKMLELGHIPTPTWQSAFKWFREKYDWTIKINKILKHTWSFTLENFTLERELFGGRFETYEEAENACLKKLIEIAENKKHL